jgi:uncharacterized membrane protein YdjX (TVP38/TMEM64 family)
VKYSYLLKWLFLGVLFVAVALTIFQFRSQLTVDSIEYWVNQFGIKGPLVFMLMFMIATVIFLPGSIFALAGGALFGPVYGSIYSLTAASIGATMAFFTARYLASDWVARKAGGKLKLLIEGINTAGWRFVAFVRLVPLFPFNFLNYALGVTKIDSRQYIIATLMCMSPGAIAYTYLGYVGREVVGGRGSPVYRGLMALSIFAALFLLPGLVRRIFPGLTRRFIR